VPLIAVGGFLGAAIALLAEIVVLRGFDRPLDPAAASVRTIAVAFVAGQAALGAVVGILSLSIPADHLALPMEPVLPIMLGIGAFGTAFAYRAGVSREPFDARARARTIVTMAGAEAISVIGCAVALLALFLGS
jgi:hypothetical protein